MKEALKEFDGTVIVVSHDREFLDGLVDKVYEFGNKRIREHLGGIYDFLQHKKMENLQELERNTAQVKDSPKEEDTSSANKRSYEAQKEINRAIKKIEKQIAESEKKIEMLEGKIAEIEEQLATPQGASDTSLYTSYADLKKQLSEEMDNWTEQTMQLEEHAQ